MENLSGLFLGGKTLKELNFPEEWEYDPDMFRWKSENHFLTVTPGTSFRETGSHYGIPYKRYLYITDEMLAKIKSNPPT